MWLRRIGTQHTTYWGHVGMYGFRGDVGRLGSVAGVSAEGSERLEQLRLMRPASPLPPSRVEGTSLSVDTAEQLNRPEQWSDLSRCGPSSRRDSVVPSVHVL